MDSLSRLARADVNRSLAYVRSPLVHRYALIVVGLAVFAPFVVAAANVSDPLRFQLLGSGSLQLDQPVQKTGNLRLKAHLTPAGVALADSVPVQEGGVFALMASLAGASTACYNDTIFRDDFDGDGL